MNRSDRKAKLKRAAAVAAAVIMCAAFSGCGSSSTESSAPAATSAETQTTAEQEVPKVTLPEKPKETETETTTTTAAPADEKPPEQGSVSGEQKESESSAYTPCLWKVTAPDGKEMYMTGSMHALKEECYPLPDYMQKAYEESEVVACELDLTDFAKSMSASLKFTDKMTYPMGDELKNHLSPGVWEGLEDYLEYYGCKPDDYRYMQPWYFYTSIQPLSLSGAGFDSGLGLDVQILKSAHNDGKEIHEVESAEEQFSILAGFSDNVYDMLLGEYAGGDPKKVEQSLLELYDAWRTGDLEFISGDSDFDIPEGVELSDEDKKGIEDFMNGMYYDRNAHMAEDAMELMESGKKTFFMVGLAHYPGEKGILSLLEDKGCTVELVSPPHQDQ